MKDIFKTRCWCGHLFEDHIFIKGKEPGTCTHMDRCGCAEFSIE